MSDNIIHISDWSKSIILEIMAPLQGKISMTDTEVIEGALFLMCLMPSSFYTEVENRLLNIAKEGSNVLSMEDEAKVLQSFKCMYGLQESGRRNQYENVIGDVLDESL